MPEQQKAPDIDYGKLLTHIMAQLHGVTPQQWEYYERNKAFLAPGEHSYNTQLTPEQEKQFRAWVQDKNLNLPPNTHDYRGEFPVDAKLTDYDMRGFWLAKQQNDPRAVESIGNDDKPGQFAIHRPDYWKTPYDASFSAESQWANPQTAPRWKGDVLSTPDGKVIMDEQKNKAEGKPLG